MAKDLGPPGSLRNLVSPSPGIPPIINIANEEAFDSGAATAHSAPTSALANLKLTEAYNTVNTSTPSDDLNRSGSQSGPDINESPPTFLSISTELRLKIYSYLMVDEEEPIRIQLYSGPLGFQPRSLSGQLLRVNKAIRSEAAEVLYSNNTFSLSSFMEFHVNNRCGRLEAILKNTGDHNTQHIRKVLTKFPIVRTWRCEPDAPPTKTAPSQTPAAASGAQDSPPSSDSSDIPNAPSAQDAPSADDTQSEAQATSTEPDPVNDHADPSQANPAEHTSSEPEDVKQDTSETDTNAAVTASGIITNSTTEADTSGSNTPVPVGPQVELNSEFYKVLKKYCGNLKRITFTPRPCWWVEGQWPTLVENGLLNEIDAHFRGLLNAEDLRVAEYKRARTSITVPLLEDRRRGESDEMKKDMEAYGWDVEVVTSPYLMDREESDDDGNSDNGDNPGDDFGSEDGESSDNAGDQDDDEDDGGSHDAGDFGWSGSDNAAGGWGTWGDSNAASGFGEWGASKGSSVSTW